MLLESSNAELKSLGRNLRFLRSKNGPKWAKSRPQSVKRTWYDVPILRTLIFLWVFQNFTFKKFVYQTKKSTKSEYSLNFKDKIKFYVIVKLFKTCGFYFTIRNLLTIFTGEISTDNLWRYVNYFFNKVLTEFIH